MTVPGINTAARAALPDADVSTATDSRIPSNNARISQGVLGSLFPLLPEGGVVPDGRARLAAVPHLSERSCGAADECMIVQSPSVKAFFFSFPLKFSPWNRGGSALAELPPKVPCQEAISGDGHLEVVELLPTANGNADLAEFASGRTALRRSANLRTSHQHTDRRRSDR